MAQVARLSSTFTTPQRIPRSANQDIPSSSTKAVQAVPGPSSIARSGHLNLDTFSPVNQNGSFEFDRVLKSGTVQKRTKKTKSWKPVYLVLRPNLLSIYKNQQESKLRHQITLSELTAVAALRDKKQKRNHVFGLFTPAKNYHLEAESAASVREWVELIRREARIDEDEADMQLISPGGHSSGSYTGFERGVSTERRRNEKQRRPDESHPDRPSSSSPDLSDLPPGRPSTTRDGVRIPPASIPNTRPASHIYDYSGNEMASLSDFSDSGPTGAAFRESSGSLSHQEFDSLDTSTGGLPPLKERPSLPRSVSGASASGMAGPKDAPTASQAQSERVIWQGFLLLLRTVKGLRQWKRVWVVLRAAQLAFYKNKDEYRAIMILQLSNLVDAVERDPISKSKRFCMQIIGIEKSYRLCATSEEDLSNWLGALKSLLAKRRDLERERDRELEN
ncbi:MAG: hypothetical protein M1814_003083 [Vezdaea aestivalis]|nr:MAG: hypothetical protein M1814_003083 [Vezdaea aestivalis]